MASGTADGIVREAGGDTLNFIIYKMLKLILDAFFTLISNPLGVGRYLLSKFCYKQNNFRFFF